ncbi:MAG: hypothetical protein IJY36_07900 [Coprobacter sp.]|nr:hypothetical protein [Coprobacter sp.]
MKKLILAAICCAMLTSCYSYTEAVCATSNPVGNKCGESVYKSGGLFGRKHNDAGINAAAKNAGITRISHVDRNYKRYGLFGMRKKVTTRVYGE